MLKTIIQPAAQALGLETVRADQIADPGQITTQIIEHLLQARVVVADVTDGNPNVYYELAIRHAFRKPVAIIAEAGTALPFDTYQMRTIFFASTDLAQAAEARDQLQAQLERALDGSVDSPISTAVDIQALRRGDSAEQQTAEILTRMDELSHAISSIDSSVEHLFKLVTQSTSEYPAVPRGPLPDVQLEILDLMKQGLPNRDIAARLGLSERSIQREQQRLFRRLHVNNRVSAIQEAIRRGLITFDLEGPSLFESVDSGYPEPPDVPD